MKYEIDYDHVINKKINGVNVVVYFSKKRNEKIKDMVLDIQIHTSKHQSDKILLQ